jgi:hypothetical protein
MARSVESLRAVASPFDGGIGGSTFRTLYELDQVIPSPRPPASPTICCPFKTHGF